MPHDEEHRSERERELQEREERARRGPAYSEREDPVAYRTETRRVTEATPWSPAQLIAFLIGIPLVVIGALLLVREGLDDLTAHTTIVGLHHTPALAITEIVFGSLMILAGAAAWAARGLMTFLGAAALAMGIIVLLEPSRLHDVLGTHSIHGWISVGIGAVTLLAALASPTMARRGRVTTRRY